ncbi:MAG: DUF234 domain-containing protein [Methanosarcinales archaeon]|nr:DUF234 domain-containing protein [Methanosarcinales archaeon]
MVSKYLDVLIKLHILTDERPVTASSKFKRRLYFITDPYFNFWFRYVYPNRIDLEANRNEEVLELIKTDFSRYCGHMFETLTRELILNRHILSNLSFTKIGRWWHKDNEIDIVCLNDDTKDIVFVECKWKNLTQKTAAKLLTQLQEKSTAVQWNNDTRTNHFGLVAKNIEGKDILRQKGFVVFDLNDFNLERIPISE